MKKDKLEEDTFDYSEIEDEIKEAKLSQRKEDFEMFEKWIKGLTGTYEVLEIRKFLLDKLKEMK